MPGWEMRMFKHKKFTISARGDTLLWCLKGELNDDEYDQMLQAGRFCWDEGIKKAILDMRYAQKWTSDQRNRIVEYLIDYYDKYDFEIYRVYDEMNPDLETLFEQIEDIACRLDGGVRVVRNFKSFNDLKAFLRDTPDL